MELTFNQYQERAITTKIYHQSIDAFIDTLGIPLEENRAKLRKTLSIFYNAFGLLGEAGEIAEKIKKIIRDKGCQISEDDLKLLKKEHGDVQWYLAAQADELGTTASEIAQENLEKLQSRKDRGVLSGSGDTR